MIYVDITGRARQVPARRRTQYGSLPSEEESGKTARAQNEINSKAKQWQLSEASFSWRLGISASLLHVNKMRLLRSMLSGIMRQTQL